MADTIVVYNQNEPVVVTIPPPDYNVIDISAGLTITIIGGEGGTGATNFLQLTDTPSTYAGSDGKLLSVSGSTITFVDAPTGDGTVTSVNTILPVDGNVTLSTANISEGTNLYYTDARVSENVTVLQNSDAIASEVSARTAADDALQSQITSNDADISTLTSNLSAETTNRTNADTTLQNNINAETTARIAADAAIQADVDQNEADSDAADTQLQNNINAEAAARIAADSALQTSIDNLTSLSLADTPSSYGSAGQVLVLNESNQLIWADNGSGSVAGVSSLNSLSGLLTIESGNDNATISEAGSTITIEVKPQQITETVKNVSGGPLTKGTPLHINASSGNTSNVVAANANASVALECHYILNEDLADQGVGEAILVGFINNVNVPDASAFSNGDEVWLADGGGFTTTRPAGAGTLIQQIGVVLNANTTNNQISGIVFGNAVKEDLPNLTSGYTWKGDANAHPQEYDLDALIARVTANEGNIGTNDTDIALLQAADTTLQGNIDAEAAARAAADTIITGDVTALTTRVDTAEINITSNDTDIFALDGRVTTAEGNISTNSTNIGSNTTAISNEVSRATGAETTLQTNIDAEASARAAADTQLQANIDTEAATRTANDTSLSNEIQSIKARLIYDSQNDKVTVRAGDDTTRVDIDNAADTVKFTANNVNSVTISSTGVNTRGLTINNGTADVFSLPTSDGSADQVLTTNGSGTVTWTDKSASDITFAVSTETASRNLAATDNTKYLRSTSATALTFTVPPQSSVTWVDNAEIIFEQAGAGQITIAAGAGVTINSSETLKSNKQYAVIALKRVGSDLWTLTGERQLV